MPALSLSPAERSALRAQAQALKPVMLIGAEGLTDAVLAEVDVHLAAHNLIKIRVSSDERDARDAIYDQICDCLSAAPVQNIGKLLVIWKPGAAEPHSVRSMSGVAGDIGTVKKGAPRIVKVVKRSPHAPAIRRSKPRKLVVRGNERVTAGGNVKRAKKRQTSAKRQNQGHQ
ncbi:RNA-binding protein [Paraburkholderia sp. 1N]|uniref:RNA-binding protein n=1 Tax=Paraburkholderia solitsugae TaxID=2675748 RepID=A0ABX2BLX7_9BURK|nr:YhbY family RNA-binding protein [Paraburkholderia solitsugae]NPT41945.1 RNA-binding protein [Paraburkholderia solitsugae]